MIVVDLETSGVDQRVHGLLSIGAVDFLEPGRQYYGECKLREEGDVMDEALEVNGFTYEDITNHNKQSEVDLVKDFLLWFKRSKDHTLAGQNPHFDLSFLEEVCRRSELDIPFARRLIDLHSVTVYHITSRGLEVPIRKKRSDVDSDYIMRYVGIPEEPRPHNALNGAVWEAEAFNRLFYNGGLFDDFEKYSVPWEN